MRKRSQTDRVALLTSPRRTRRDEANHVRGCLQGSLNIPKISFFRIPPHKRVALTACKGVPGQARRKGRFEGTSPCSSWTISGEGYEIPFGRDDYSMRSLGGGALFTLPMCFERAFSVCCLGPGDILLASWLFCQIPSASDDFEMRATSKIVVIAGFGSHAPCRDDAGDAVVMQAPCGGTARATE